MKKLLTLFALLAVFLGVKAVEMQDFKVDYSQAGTTTLGWRASVIQEDWITADEDGLHLYNPEKTENFWDYQIIIFSGVNLEQEQNYTIKIVAKVSDGTANVRCNLGNWGGGMQSAITVNSTEYQEYIIEGSAVSADNFLIVQFGDYVGTVSFKSVTITHEGREDGPVTWMNILTNGDAEGEYGEIACAQSKEYGVNDDKPHAAEIEILDGNKVFVTHAQEVNPPIVFDVDTELWGTTYAAGDPKPDNVWQNQFWIALPRALKADEPYRVSFKYKASEDARVTTQSHTMPGNYLGGSPIGELRFTTEWQTYESREFAAVDGMQAIDFLLGEDKQYERNIDFYFDDICVSVMDLKEGFFAAGIDTNTDANWNTFNFDNAVEFEWDADLEAYVAVVGTIGDQDSWVNEVMVSTKYGNDKGFKANTIKVIGRVQNDPMEWLCYSAAAKTSINLPAKGVWQIAVDANDEVMNFIKLEGEQETEPVDIVTNSTEIVVKGQERDDLADYADEIREEEGGTGQTWDNQFFIQANRTLKAGETTVVEFDYMGTEYAKTTTQSHSTPGGYLHWSAIGDVNFTPEWQHFEREFTIPKEADGMQNICFNMAEIKEACDYHIMNIKWYLKGEENYDGKTLENLINAEGTENFYVKEGAGTAPYIYNNVPEPQPQDPEPENLEMVYNIDYSTYGGFPFFVLSYVPEFDNGHMTDYGAMYTYKAEADLTDEDNVVGTAYTQGGALYYKVALRKPAWHQYFLADGIHTEIDEKYVVKAKVRASEPVTINVNMAWSWSENPISASVYIPDEWAEVEWEYSGIGGTQCWLVAQPGVSTATIDWASLAVYKYQNGQQQPVEWIEMLTNGDAETSWEEMGLADVNFNDAENNYKVSAWGRVKGENIGYDAQRDMENWCPFPATIEVDPDSVSNHIFVVHASYADSMDEYGDASAWDNQFWIQSPQGWKTGDLVKIHFRYKASQNARTSTQVHKQAPMEYLHWKAIGDINFTTEWQEFDGIMTIGDNMSGTWSIAFNLNEEVKDPTDFYFDDLSWQAMKLEEGWFVAGANLNSGLEYDCSNATEFVYDEGIECYTATIGEFGKQETWVNQLMVSTVRGDNQAFKGRTIKIDGTVTGDPDYWFTYTEASNAKIKLPAEGVWQVYIYPEDKVISFAMLEGIIIDSLEVIPNPTEVVVYGKERNYTENEAIEFGIDLDTYQVGYAWDNQFAIVANRPLKAGEETIISFKYKASTYAKTTTQCHGASLGAYMHWAAIGDVNFDTEWQEFEKTFTIPEEADGMQTLAFNMAEIKEACNYQITDVVWMTEDMTETLIDTEGIKNFWVKEGAGTNPREFDPYYVPQETLMGDVDSNGQVNVTDVVMIIDNILGKTQWNFNAEAADVNYDTYINVTDVVMVIDHILGKVNLNRAAAADAEMGAISLSTDMTTISLTNPSAYTAFQMDVTLPMGVSLEDVLLTDRAAGSHSVVIRKMDDGSYRIIGVSMQNEAFEGNAGDLLKLQLAGNAQGAVAINNVLFVTPQGVQHELAGVNAFGDVTGIANVRGNKEVTGNVFDLQGRQMNNAQLKKGLYILNGKKQIVK